MEKHRSPFWLLPNLLSIDAPLVAVAWMWMLAQALRVEYIPHDGLVGASTLYLVCVCVRSAY